MSIKKNQNQDEQRPTKASGFDKLRLQRRATAGAAAGVAAIGLAGQADAVPTSTSLTTTFGGVTYSEAARNSIVESPLTNLPGATGDSAYGINDATTTAGGRTDAFDGFAGITVNGAAFNQPNDEIDFTTTADGGFISTITPADIDGIETSLDYFLDDSSPTARVFATFTNTNDTAESVEVAYGGDLGSDEDTIIEDSSTGDSTFDQALDRWIITSDDGNEDQDPFLTLVRFGPEGQVASSTPAVPGQDSNGDFDEFGDIWTLAPNPGETQSLLWFVQLNPSLTVSQSRTGDFDSLTALSDAGLLADLSDAQIAQTVNWVQQPAPPTTAVPEPASTLLVGMAIVAIAGVTWFRRSWRSVTA